MTKRMGHWSATVLARRPVGGFHVVAVSAGAAAAQTKPGQFASVAVGGAGTAMLLRRQLWIADTSAGGRHGGALDVVVDGNEPGGAWLIGQAEGTTVDVMAPLGRPFLLPRDPTVCLLVGFGAANGALSQLAQQLMDRGNRIHALLPSDGSAFGTLTARRLASQSAEFTENNRAEHIATAIRDGCQVVYSAGTPPQVREVATDIVATGAAVPHQTALHLGLVCAVGTCTTCAIPVHGRDGITRMVRACADGPVFNAELIRWADLGTVPGDCLGATLDSART